jgi:uncharacterized membrane protein YphA (DoxX/SURF4 family)
VPGHPFHAPVFAATMMGAAGVIETIGGTLMFLGLFTRPVAFVVSGQMAVAYFTQQRARRKIWLGGHIHAPAPTGQCHRISTHALSPSG